MAIPLHGPDGGLLGYAGRVVDDAAITEENPRYRFPGTRERDGKLYEFRKSLFLYNGHRIQAPVGDLIVVESFTAVWWLAQCGLPPAVATMGSDCSDEQAEIVASSVKADGRVWIMPDGDKAGLRLAEALLRLVAPRRFVRWARLQDGRQPTDLTADELKSHFAF